MLFKYVAKINVELYIEEKIYKDVISVFRADKKKTRLIFYQILLGKYNNDLYGKENPNKKCRDITAMKYKGKPNRRIYCKELFDGVKKIIAIHILENKSFTKVNDKSLLPKLEAMKDYEYEFKKIRNENS